MLSFKVLEEKIHMFPLKDIFMNFMLHLNEDFDDDLLQDAMSILVPYWKIIDYIYGRSLLFIYYPHKI